MLQKRKGVLYGKEEINFINEGKLWKLGADKYHENAGSGRLGAGRSDVSFSAGFPAETGNLGHWHSLPDFLRLYLLYVALPGSF